MYCCFRKQLFKEGIAKEYGYASYLNIRAGLQRYLVGPPNNREIDIHNDREFESTNQVFQGKLKIIIHEGCNITKRKTIHKILPRCIHLEHCRSTIPTFFKNKFSLRYPSTSKGMAGKGAENWKFICTKVWSNWQRICYHNL